MSEFVVNELSMKQFVTLTKERTRYLLSKWLVILALCIGCGSLGILYAWLRKPLYTAQMSFVTDTESKAGFGAYAGLAAQFGIDMGGSNSSLFEGDNLIELLKSRQLIIKSLLTPIGATSKNQLLVDYYLTYVLNSKTKVASLVDGRGKDSVLLAVADEILKDELSINKRDKKLTIIDLEVKSKDEAFAKMFAEVLTQNAITFYTDYKVKKTRQNVAILERQTDSVRRILYGNIEDVATITDLNVNPIRLSSKTAAQRKQVELQTSGALYSELIKNLELSRMALRKETPLIQIVDTPILPLPTSGIGRFKMGMIFGFVGGILAITILLWRRKPIMV
jgi:uncharacterized protein involved in exopolysaccharide biosynthesis